MSRPAPLVTAVLAQAAMEARLTARRGENLLAIIGLPAAALVFFGTMVVAGTPGGVTGGAAGSPTPIERLLPAVLALGIVASGLVNLGIATAYERGYGVLKRLGGAPLGGPGLLAAKLLVVAAIALVQVAALVILATVLGWRPVSSTSWLGVTIATIAGIAAFAGFGLLVAGALRPEAALVAANGLFLAAILLGGVPVPLADLPGPVAAVARLLPTGALADAFDRALSGRGDIAGPLAMVVAWALAAFAAAARTFRWE